MDRKLGHWICAAAVRRRTKGWTVRKLRSKRKGNDGGHLTRALRLRRVDCRSRSYPHGPTLANNPVPAVSPTGPTAINGSCMWAESLYKIVHTLLNTLPNTL